MKRVVIVGGGYAGTALARTLDTAAEVDPFGDRPGAPCDVLWT